MAEDVSPVGAGFQYFIRTGEFWLEFRINSFSLPAIFHQYLLSYCEAQWFSVFWVYWLSSLLTYSGMHSVNVSL